MITAGDETIDISKDGGVSVAGVVVVDGVVELILGYWFGSLMTSSYEGGNSLLMGGAETEIN